MVDVFHHSLALCPSVALAATMGGASCERPPRFGTPQKERSYIVSQTDRLASAIVVPLLLAAALLAAPGYLKTDMTGFLDPTSNVRKAPSAQG